MTEARPQARHALAAELPQLSATLRSAFIDDPVNRWMFDDDAKLNEHLQTWMQFNLDMGLTRGHTYSVGNGMGAAIWSPPDVPLFDALWGPRMVESLTELLGDRAGKVMKALSKALEHASDEPSFYLFVLGVHSDAQGQGLGADLIRPVLEICDRQGIAAHLESSNSDNLSFYKRHGFEVVSEVEMEPGGPIVRPMHRAPR